MRRKARVDANHAEVVAALRAIGCSVQSLAEIGEGCPDLLVGYHGMNALIEVKDENKPPSARKLTDDQVDWHGGWRGQVAIANSAEEAIAIMQVLTRSI